MTISIAIPCYGMKGSGSEILQYTFIEIEKQSYKNYEVVISDHSEDDNIENLCKVWSNRFQVNYNRFEEKRGSPAANTNNCLKKSHGELIKILNQDDYFYDKESLKKTVDNFDMKKGWLLSKYIHTTDRKEFFNEHTPVMHDRVHLQNLIGFPSCLTLRNKDILFYNENLRWAYDCEYYKRLSMRFGEPFIFNEITVVNYLWDGQMSNAIVDKEMRLKEKLHIASLYGNILHYNEIE